MDKWRGRYLMTAGIFLQIFGAVGFTLAESSDGGSVILAIPLAIGGLLLYGRGVRDISQQGDPPPAAAPRPRLEEMILNLQEDVNRLREDREFYRELYVDRPGGHQEESARAPGRSRDLTYRLVPERSDSPRPPSSAPR